MRSNRSGLISGPTALALGLAVGAGVAFVLGCPIWRGSAKKYLGHSGEAGEETSYDNEVDTAADDSFPASDPPSYSGPRHAGRPRKH